MLAGGPSAPGFTLLELMIAVSIIAILASMGVPMYEGALGTARTAKAKQELRIIANDIDTFRSTNKGVLPLTLADVDHGGRRDPWGNPYCYLNFKAGTGDGFDWAVDQGLVDPGVLQGDGVTAIPADVQAAFDAAVVQAVSVVPVFLARPIDTNQVKRRDQFLFPLNTDYDLFSLGGNRTSDVALGGPNALDDVIRANDGGFFGLARDY